MFVEPEKQLLYFENQVRGFNVVLGAFQALNKDMCGRGMSLPVAVNGFIKILKKVKSDVDKSSLSDEKKKELITKVDAFLAETESLPQDPGPCQKTAGNCKIGPGCFATGALDLLKLITEPKPVTEKPSI